MEKIKLLFVEDDSSFAFVIKGSLELSGIYEVQTASNGEEGLEVFDLFQPDVIVSDIEMPVLDGMEMIKKIRLKDEFIPILLATGRTDAKDVLDGYSLNVDNFIKKPFLPEELSAHVQAIFKRTRVVPLNGNSSNNISMGEYVFNVDRQLLQWKHTTYKLTSREAQILAKLYAEKDNLVKRDCLLEELWGINHFFTSRSLDVFINSLRKYLSHDSAIHIETIRGKGLRLIIV